MSKKILKRKKNKPYIVTHWHSSLNLSDSETRNFTLSEYIYIISSYSIYRERNKTKKWFSSLKNMRSVKNA